MEPINENVDFLKFKLLQKKKEKEKKKKIIKVYRVVSHWTSIAGQYGIGFKSVGHTVKKKPYHINSSFYC